MTTRGSMPSRGPDPRAIVIALWTAALACGPLDPAFAGDAPGVGQLTPGQTVRTFYELMAEQQCAKALELQPGYPLDRCQGFELVDLKKVVEHAQTRGAALVSLDIEYRMHGKAARQRGCVILRRLDTRWIYQDFKKADCAALVGTITPVAPAVRPSATAAPTPLDPATAHQPATQIPANAPALGRPALPDPPAGVLADGGAGPINALRRHFAAIGRSERPMALASIEVLLHNDGIGVAVIAYRATDDRGPDDRNQTAPLEGLAWMQRQRGEWKTIRIYDPSQAAEVNARYAQALAPGQPLAGPAPGPRGRDGAGRGPAPPLPAPLDTTVLTQEPGVPEATPDGRTQGESYRVLERCWARRDLLGSPAEKRSRSGLPPDRTGPAPALITQAEATPAQSGAASGSIRWIDLDDPNGKVIALTFDLCEQADEQSGYDTEIINYLREQDVRATFYAGGKWMRSHRERAKQLMVDPRFEVGNHAWTHGNLRVLKGTAMRNQILWTQAQYLGLRDEIVAECATKLGPDAVARIPQVPATFRFPYGTCNDESLAALASYGLAAVQWDIVTGDPGHGQSAAAIADKVIKGVKPGRGSIVIMHANGRGFATAKALRTIIPALQHQGYQFVTVTELLGRGQPHIVPECYEQTPGDNKRYDALFGRGTGED